MRHLSRFLIILAATATAACGGSSDGSNGITDPGKTDGGTSVGQVTNGKFTATINGTAWSAIGAAAVGRSAANALSIAAASTTYGVSFALQNVTGPRTIQLTSSLLDGAVAIVATGTGQGWSTGYPGTSGTITITTLTASRVAGTFSFDAAPVLQGTTGTLQVRNGSFDLTF